MAIRFSVPAAESRYAWLPALLATYYVSDAQLEEDLAARAIKPACHRGCHACCLKPTVPLTEPELAGISRYASEVLQGELRETVKRRLLEHETRLECPFLVERVCAIYPVRPLACRQFLVTTRPCEVGEDPLQTRPDDIVKLTRERVIRPVAMRLLDWPPYRLATMAAKRKAFERGFIAANARDMCDYDWSQIARTMEHFEKASSKPAA